MALARRNKQMLINACHHDFIQAKSKETVNDNDKNDDDNNNNDDNNDNSINVTCISRCYSTGSARGGARLAVVNVVTAVVKAAVAAATAAVTQAEMEMEESQKAWKWGTRDQKAEGFFFYIKGVKKILALCPVSNSHRQITLYFALRLSSRGKTRLRRSLLSEDSMLLT